MSFTQVKGAWAENLILEEYLKKGFLFLGRNIRCGGGELDLVFQWDEHLTFVEVRYLRLTSFMHPVESISHKKLLNLRRACQAYHNKYYRVGVDYSLDIATVTGASSSPKIEIWSDVLEG